jgi:hypothetical protein
MVINAVPLPPSNSISTSGTPSGTIIGLKQVGMLNGLSVLGTFSVVDYIVC